MLFELFVSGFVLFLMAMKTFRGKFKADFQRVGESEIKGLLLTLRERMWSNDYQQGFQCS